MKFHYETVLHAPGESFSIEIQSGAILDCVYHVHPEFELTFVESGFGTRFVGDLIEPFREQDLILVGGMVPPLAIALAMLLFKGKFTPKERQSTITNFIMGLSFITEGAIPFAASDPVHVIPPCAIGAAVAGALSMLFNCTLPAPHGGIFVFGVITNWPMYIAALVAGVIVAAILLGIFRKKRPQD